MATKTKFDQTIEQQLSKLNNAQREVAQAQFSIYKKNRSRISDIDTELEAIRATSAQTMDAFKYKQTKITTLAYERGQLAMANSKIAADLFDFLEDK